MDILKDKEFSRLAMDVSIDDEQLSVHLQDGRIINVPIAYFPALGNADPAVRNNWRLIGGGVGIHWDDIDEDISVEGLLQ